MQVENVELSQNEDSYSAQTILTYLPFVYPDYKLVKDTWKNNYMCMKESNCTAETREAGNREIILASSMFPLQYLITFGIVIEEITTPSNRGSPLTYLVLTAELEHDFRTKLCLRKGQLMKSNTEQELNNQINLKGQVIFCQIKRSHRNGNNNWREDEEIQLFSTSSFLQLLLRSEKDIEHVSDINMAMTHLKRDLVGTKIPSIDEINFNNTDQNYRFELHIEDTISFQFTSNFWYLDQKQKLKELGMIIKEFLRQRSRISKFVKRSPLSMTYRLASDNVKDNIFYSMFLYSEEDQEHFIKEYLNPPAMPCEFLSLKEELQENNNKYIFYQKFKEEFSMWLNEDIVSDKKYKCINRNKFFRSNSDEEKENLKNFEDIILKGYYHGIKSSPNFFQIIKNLLRMDISKVDFEGNREILDFIGIQIIKEFLKRILPESLASNLL